MNDYQPLGKAAQTAKVSRVSVSRWVKMGLIKSKAGPRVGNMFTTLVSVKEVKELAKSRRPGRPKKETA